MKIVVIGAGLMGTLVSRELCRYDLQVTLIERAPDVGMGISKANSGIVHAGYDDEPGTIRSRFCVPGNAAYETLKDELEIDVQRVGSHVVAFRREDLNTLDQLLKRGIENKVPHLRVVDTSELHSMEPHLNKAAIASLWAPTAAVTEPWQVCIAAAENAVDNGLHLKLGENVIGIETSAKKVKTVVTDRGRYDCDVVVNAAGLYADRIANLAGDVAIPLSPRRGEYILLNKFTAHDLVNSILFPVPSTLGKGMLVTPTVDKGILLGPTAEDLPRALKDDRATTRDGLAKVVASARFMVPDIDIREAVKVFSGSRPESPSRDFWLGPSERVQGLVHAGAMRSPGLTAAPAIAPFLVEEIQRMTKETFRAKSSFNPRRKRIVSYIKDLSLEAYDRILKGDSSAGRVVCVCNKVTEKEIIEAIHRGARSLDGIKFRTRALFGECQGGFCSHRLLQILSRELNIPGEKLDFGGDGSWIVNGKVRP